MEESLDAEEVWEDEEDWEEEELEAGSSLALMLEIQDTPGYKLRERISTFSSSVYAFRGNASELEGLLKKLIEPTSPVPWAGNAHVSQLIFEVDRLLHNFTASAMTLVDHARAFHKDLYKESEDAKKVKELPGYVGQFDDYQARLEADFANDPLSQFIKRLRNYTIHYRLPTVAFNQSFTPGAGGGLEYGRAFLLDGEQLLQYKDWGSAKNYINSYPEGDVDLFKAIVDYRDKVMEHYEWFMKRLEEIHEEDFRILREKEIVLATLELESSIDRCLHLPEQIDYTEEQAFDQFASDTFLRELSSAGDAPSERARRAIELIGEHTEVSVELADKIRQLYSRRNLLMVRML